MKSAKGLAVKAIAVVGVIFLILPMIMLAFTMPVFGWDLDLKDIAGYSPGDAHPERRPPGSENAPSLGIVVGDMTANAGHGVITSIQFTLGVREGFPPINLSSFSLGVNNDTHPPMNPILSGNVEIETIADPNGLMERHILDSNASIRVRLTGLYVIPGSVMELGYGVHSGASGAQYFRTPIVLTEPPLLTGSPFYVTINDTDNRYPRPTANDWIISNRTVLENVRYRLERRIIVVDNGSLVLRNSTLSIDSWKNHRQGIYIGSGGRFEAVNSTLNATNSTVFPNDTLRSDDQFIFESDGEVDIEQSCIADAYGGMMCYFAPLRVIASSFKTSLFCHNSSFTIVDNSFTWVTDRHGSFSDALLMIRCASGDIVNNSFHGVRARHPYDGQGIFITDDSTPFVHKNLFVNMSWGIHVDGASPRIVGNVFKQAGGAGFSQASGLFSGNTIQENWWYDGVGITYYSSVVIENNSISSRRGISVRMASATVVNNTFSDYQEYGASFENAFVTLTSNKFYPNLTYTKSGCEVIQTWMVGFEVSDQPMNPGEYVRKVIEKPSWQVTVNPLSESSSVELWKEPQRAKVWARSPALSDQVNFGSTIPPPYFSAKLTQFVIGNDGEKKDYNPYTFTIEWYGSKSSFLLKVDRPILKYAYLKSRTYVGSFAFLLGLPLVICAAYFIFSARRERKGPGPLPVAPVDRVLPPAVKRTRPRGQRKMVK